MSETNAVSTVVIRNTVRLSSLLVFPLTVAILGALTSLTNFIWDNQDMSWATVLIFSILATIQPLQTVFAKFTIRQDELCFKAFLEKEICIASKEARWYTIEKTSKWSQLFWGSYVHKITIRHGAYDDITFTTDREEVLNWLAQNSELKKDHWA
ncbi:MAG: hypothetical protein EP346_09040 [Bacteroidetes bacterium]|nr:MAG: hypothetical protein EP346_09040 [Bacteroidota bacterium]